MGLSNLRKSLKIKDSWPTRYGTEETPGNGMVLDPSKERYAPVDMLEPVNREKLN